MVLLVIFWNSRLVLSKPERIPYNILWLALLAKAQGLALAVLIVIILIYKNQRAYFAIPVGDIKGLMILKNVLSCFKPEPSYRSVQISPRFL